VADDAMADLWWTKAEKPFQFYAFCVEWANLVRANARGEDYVCMLPVAMDGSCNGLQHFSALFRDEVGGRAVNVVPQQEPQDIYNRIAENVLKRITEDSSELSSLWLGLHAEIGLVSRKLTKRPTMTFGYGSKRYGFKEQLMEYLRHHEDSKLIRSRFTNDKGESLLGPACGYMGDLIWDALRDEVVAAFDGMAWMQEAVKGIAGADKAVQWTVPLTGFPVAQQYYKLEKRRIKTILAGSVTMPSVYLETEEVNGRKQANSIAPNFIHSLDAAALMLTVASAQAEGIGQFAMIHDSYGTAPADCALLADVLRRSFARLYTQHDIVADLHSQLAAQWEKPEECPLPPAKGSLDVSVVMGSTYFFA
jgi:DNA-directed RNA polymerase